MLQRLYRILSLRPGEGRRVFLLSLYTFFTTAMPVLGKTLQYSVFLDEYGRGMIPYAFLASAAAVVLVSIAFSGLSRMVPTRVLVPSTTVVIAFGFGAWKIFAERIPHAPFVLYVWVEVAALLVLVQSWNFVNNACDPRQAKRFLPLAALGASFAYLAGGFLVRPLIRLGLPAESLSWLVMGTLLVALLVQRLLASDLTAERAMEESSRRALVVKKEHLGFVASLKTGFTQIAGSKLLRLIALTTVLSILVVQLLDYQFMSTLRSRFHKEELAAFYGVFLGVLGGAQILLQLFITGRLLGKLGGPVCVAVAPTFAASVSLLFVFLPGFWIFVGLMFGHRLLKTSFYSPSLQALYTPVPRLAKIQSMSLIKGVASPLAYAMGAVGLIFLARSLDLRWISVGVSVLAGTSVMVLVAKARKAYIEALHLGLERRKLDLEHLADEEVPLVVDGTVLQMIEKAVEQGPEGRAVFALQMLKDVPLSQCRSVVLFALESPMAMVRKQAVILLEEGGPSEAQWIVDKALKDPDADVVCQGLRALVGAGQKDWIKTVAAMLKDPRPMVRATSAVCLGSLGEDEAWGSSALLTSMVMDSNPEVREAVAVAMREVGDRSLAAICKVLLSDKSPKVRAEALITAQQLRLSELLEDVMLCFVQKGPMAEAMAALPHMGEGLFPALRRLMDDGRTSEKLLLRIPTILGQIPHAESQKMLVELLAHPSSEVRLRAIRVLGRSQLRKIPMSQVMERVHVEARTAFILAGARKGLAGRRLNTELFLSELDDREMRARRRLLGLVGLAADQKLSDTILANLESGSRQLRSSAVELLENVVHRELAQALVPLMEGVPDETALDFLPANVRDAYVQAKSHPVQSIIGSPDHWLKLCLAHDLPELVRSADSLFFEEVNAVRPLIEKILFLKTVPIFGGLSAEELHHVARIAEEVSIPSGGIIVKQSDPGDAMYLVLDGAVSVLVNKKQVARLGQGECFGEMALLDNQPRSADVVAASDTDLLRIDAQSFDELLEQKHAIVKSIFKVLSMRLRKATVSSTTLEMRTRPMEEKSETAPGSQPQGGD